MFDEAPTRSITLDNLNQQCQNTQANAAKTQHTVLLAWPAPTLGLHLITSLIVSLTPMCDLETGHAFLNANSLIFVDLHMHQDV